MVILNIETATEVCSVSLSENGRLLFEKTSLSGPSHASFLGVFVEEAVQTTKRLGLAVSAVAVSAGPGSYTGLRIGVSFAKGLCFGWHVPLISIPTLDILAQKAISSTVEGKLPNALYCAMIDARRMEVYTALYDSSLRMIRGIEALVVTEEAFINDLERQPIYFFGNGVSKCKSVIQSPHAVFLDNLYPSAAVMIPLSENAFQNNRFEDVAYFEPCYLKDFIATIPKRKL